MLRFPTFAISVTYYALSSFSQEQGYLSTDAAMIRLVEFEVVFTFFESPPFFFWAWAAGTGQSTSVSQLNYRLGISVWLGLVRTQSQGSRQPLTTRYGSPCVFSLPYHSYSLYRPRKEDIGVLLAALFWIHPSHTRVIHMHPTFLA
jgi:hypothetical protein